MKNKKWDVYLVVTMILALILNTWGIWKEQYANAYYTAAVKSMMQSFSNFFFASFDPGGYITVDKPPVAFWIQTLFAKVFGLYGWSVILPQALAGVGSVLIVYLLVKPTFGQKAARIASLVLAVSPIAVAVSRTNNIDSLLVFTLLLATWMLFKGIKGEKKGWIFGAFAVIGIGFNMKMLQAYMIVPAMVVFYLLATKINWKKKIGILTGAVAILMVVSLSWAVVVDMIPASKRPYIGSSQTNSVLELAFGYNGLQRLTGQQGSGGSGGNGGNMGEAPSGNMGQPPSGNASQLTSGTTSQSTSDNASQSTNGTTSQSTNDNTNQSTSGTTSQSTSDNVSQSTSGNSGPPTMMQGQQPPSGRDGMGGQSGMFGTGTAGPFRLFQSELAGQISWLLPFVIVACLGLFSGMRRQLSLKHKEILFWLAWLIPVAGFFSVAQFFHQYYLIMLTPPIAALVGIGFSTLESQFNEEKGWKAYLFPAGILVTMLFQLFILFWARDSIGTTLTIVLGVLTIILLGLLLKNRGKHVAKYISVAGLILMLVGPFYWSIIPIMNGGNATLPQAGPSSGGMGGMGFKMTDNANGNNPNLNGNNANTNTNANTSTNANTNINPNDMNGNSGNMRGPGGGDSQGINEQLLAYLEKNRDGEKYLFATTDSSTAAPYIIETGEAVMAMGGFSGNDPAMTVAELKEKIANKEVKYFLLSGGKGGNSELVTWITENGKEIPQSEWDSTAQSTDQQTNITLYEVQ